LNRLLSSSLLLLSLCFYYQSAFGQAAENSQQQLAKTLQLIKTQVLTEPKQAHLRLHNLKSSITIDPQSPLYIDYLLLRAESANYSYQFDQFTQDIETAVSLTELQAELPQRASLLLYLAISKQRHGNFTEAFILLEQAKKLALKSNNQALAIRVSIEKAYFLALGEEYEAALELIQQAYIQSNQTDQTLLRGLIEEVLGVIYLYMAKPEDSLRHFEKSYDIYQQLKYPYFISEATLGIATNYRYWKKWPQAIEWLNKYHQASKSIRSTYSLFYFNYGLSMTYANQADCQSAMLTIDKAMNIDGYKDYKAELLKRKALCLAQQGEFELAEQSVEQASQIFQQMPELIGTSWQIEVDKIAAQVAALKGDYESAYGLIDQYYLDFIQVHKRNTSKLIEKLKLSGQLEKEQLEIGLLENKNLAQTLKLAEQQRENEVQQTWLVGFVLVFLLVLSFGFLQYKTSRKLKSLSITDELTGLHNRRFMFNSLKKLLETESEKSCYHSLMLIDVDDLKPINDKYGHQDGDKAIKMVADIGSRVLRYGDIFARIGGDEYMLLLTRSDAEQEVAIANRIIREINQQTLTTSRGEALNISVSIGITSIKDHNASVESIYSKVDEALYRAKLRGRNCASH
jgi:two-component system, cell cycle response regulator